MRAISLSLNFKPQLCKIELKKKKQKNTSFVLVHKANPKLPTTMTNDA